MSQATEAGRAVAVAREVRELLMNPATWGLYPTVAVTVTVTCVLTVTV